MLGTYSLTLCGKDASWAYIQEITGISSISGSINQGISSVTGIKSHGLA